MVNTETCLPWGLRLPPRMPWHYQMQWFTSRSGHWSKVLRGFMSITLALPSPRNTQSMRPSWKMRVGVTLHSNSTLDWIRDDLGLPTSGQLHWRQNKAELLWQVSALLESTEKKITPQFMVQASHISGWNLSEHHLEGPLCHVLHVSFWASVGKWEPGYGMVIQILARCWLSHDLA